MKPLIANLITAVTVKNDDDTITSSAPIQEVSTDWLNRTEHGLPANGVTLSTDGITEDDIRVTGATYVLCWWKEACVAVYFTAEAKEEVVLRAIQAGESVPVPVEDTEPYLPLVYNPINSALAKI